MTNGDRYREHARQFNSEPVRPARSERKPSLGQVAGAATALAASVGTGAVGVLEAAHNPGNTALLLLLTIALVGLSAAIATRA